MPGAVFGPVHGGRPRWLRLQPADALDVVLLAGIVAGLLFTLVHHALDGLATGRTWLDVSAGLLFMAHGSTPILSFLALALYLTRWGRTVGRARTWVWAGFFATAPLWFLAGLPIAVRGAGDVTFLVVPWNLAALAVMAWGVHRTLGSPRDGSERPR